MEMPCRPVRRLVAGGPVCAVEECTCGVLHVSLGALTLRLQKEAVASIYETLGEALARVSADPPSSGPLGLLANLLPTERPS